MLYFFLKKFIQNYLKIFSNQAKICGKKKVNLKNYQYAKFKKYKNFIWGGKKFFLKKKSGPLLKNPI